MPRKRQAAPAVDEDGIVVRSLGLRLPSDHRIEPHGHGWNQLVYATEGVMSVETPSGCWVVPPQRAVWIPAGFVHSVRTTGAVRMRTVYLAPALDAQLPDACCVVQVTPLLRELILETVRRGMLHDDVPAQRSIATVLADQIGVTTAAPLELKLPTDARARAVAERARAELSVMRPLSVLARGSGASPRTIERLFVQETGMTFGRWLQHARALRALECLAGGDSVTEAGFAVGYESTSAFIAMFKRVLGTTPGDYFADPSRTARQEARS